MISIRKAEERGHFDFGWLNTYHSFSFGEYHDANHMGFRVLRVLNEDYIQPASRFAEHPHRDMEIITYVLDGELSHRDSMGNGSTIRAGDVQRMTAGTGVMHSEANESNSSVCHIFQIWLFPEKRGLEPGYEQKTFSAPGKKDRLQPVVSRDGRDGSLLMHQDANIYASLLTTGKMITHDFSVKKYAWIQVASGMVAVNDQMLNAGDGAAISDEHSITLFAKEDAEFILIEMA
jgi:redox-sensitive bicupin YhaK (pirin superfamily)